MMEIGRVVTGLVVACIIGLPGVVFPQQPPEDVSRIGRTIESVKLFLAAGDGDVKAGAQLAAAVFAAASETVLGLAESSNISREVAVRREDFDRDLKSRWNSEVRTAIRENDPGRQYLLLSDLIRTATSKADAEIWLSKWLGVPPPGNLGELIPRRDGTQWWRGGSLGEQIVALSRTRDLHLLAGETVLLAESGGVSGGNGIVDAGEWVQVRFMLGNDSANPYFSSSAWLKSLNPCLWTDPSVEHVVEEMSPRGGKGGFQAWLYVSEQCPLRKAAKLRVSLRDTQRTSGGGISFDLAITPHRRLSAQLTSLVIDSDVPGSSDGSDNPVLSPGLSYEVSVGLEFGRKSQYDPRSAYRASAEAGGLFDNFSYRPVNMISRGSSNYAAGDDLDIRVVGEELYKSRAYALRRSSSWAEKQNGPMVWLAVDTEVLDVPPGWKRVQESPSEGTASELSADEIVKLVLANIHLESRRSSPSLAGAVAATDGHEVVFDVDAYRAAYRLATGEVETTAIAEDVPVVRYVYRHFVPLRIASSDFAPAPLPQVAPVRKRPTYRPVPPPEPTPVPMPLARVDIGLDFTQMPIVAVDGADDSVWLTGTSPQLSLGRSWCFVANVDIHAGSFEGDYGYEYSPKQFLVWLGAGHIFGAGGTIEFEPALQVGAGKREMGDLSESALGIRAHGTARVFFSENVGFFGSLGYDITSDGPQDDGEDTLGGNQFKVGIGVSGRF